MVIYNNGKIYKIENNIDDMIYIGSTTKQYLSQRMDNHRSCYKGWKSGKSTKVMVFDMFEKHGIENCFIVLLELVNCNTKDELLAREAYYIKTLVCVNKCIPLRTDKQYRVDNKEKLKEKYDDNKYKINKQRKIKYTCECGSISCYSHKSRHEKSIKHLTYLENKNIILL